MKYKKPNSLLGFKSRFSNLFNNNIIGCINSIFRTLPAKLNGYLYM